MTDDPIKAALREAAWAQCEARARVNECEDTRCPRKDPCQWCAAGAATAVAAFLRALPEGSSIPTGVGDLRAQIGPMPALAAAVVRAAQEAGDG